MGSTEVSVDGLEMSVLMMEVWVRKLNPSWRGGCLRKGENDLELILEV